MPILSLPTRTLFVLLAASAAAAQNPTSSSATAAQTSSAALPTVARPAPHKSKPKPKTYQPPFNPNVILLDPAHGGQDNGANLGEHAGSPLEKDFDIALC